MLKKIVIIIVFFITLNTFCHEKLSIVSDISNVPISIYVLDFQKEVNSFNWFSNKLKLSEFKFMILDESLFIENNLTINLRNVNKQVSFEAMNISYRKAELNKYFFTGYDLNNIHWQRN